MRVGTAVPTGRVVTYPPPTVTGTCPPLEVVCAPPSGSNFPVGTTPVTCTVTDGAGNSRSCSFTVTVVLRPRLSISLNTANNTIVVSWPDDGMPWVLEEALELRDQTLWQPSQAVPTLVGGRWQVVVPRTQSAMRFYQLRGD
jgi:hypothetical protein